MPAQAAVTLIAASPDADAQLKGLCLARLLLAPRPQVVAEAGLRDGNVQALLAADGVKYIAALLLERRPALSCAVRGVDAPSTVVHLRRGIVMSHVMSTSRNVTSH